jgi:hypothetical protein
MEPILIKLGLPQQLFVNISKTEFSENLKNVLATDIR